VSPYDPEIVARLAALCEVTPDREVCGFLLRRDGGLHVLPVPNAADRHHAVDPDRFPRTSRDSYLMEPKEQLRIHRELEEWGARSSRSGTRTSRWGAYFSAKDRADAVVEGQPAVPGAEYWCWASGAGG